MNEEKVVFNDPVFNNILEQHVMYQNENTPPNEMAYTNLLDHHLLSENLEPIPL